MLAVNLSVKNSQITLQKERELIKQLTPKDRKCSFNTLPKGRGVVKLGEHGLFGQEDYVDLKKASKEIYNHKGIVWTEVVSLRQEDAERLGYDTPEAWRNLVRSKQFEIAYYHKFLPII